MKEKLIKLLEYIESKKSHGRATLYKEITRLKLQKSTFAQNIIEGPTSIGKNQAKDVLLYSLISKLKD